MKVKDVRLFFKPSLLRKRIIIRDQNGSWVCSIDWGIDFRTKPQAIAIANRLCDRFNAGQEGK